MSRYNIYIIVVAVFITNAIALECRFGMSIHFAHTKRIQLKEKKILCQNTDAVCGRVTLHARADNKNVTVHTASCINETYCEDDQPQCSVAHLENMTDPVDFQKIYTCRTKCCKHNNCNIHSTKTPDRASRKRPVKVNGVKYPQLQCYTGIREHDHMGRTLTHELEEKTCLYAAHGGRRLLQSRCLSAEVVTRQNKSDALSLVTTVSHCLHLSMCKSLTCDDMQAIVTKDEGVIVERCNITCCSEDFCNGATRNSLPNVYLIRVTLTILLTLLYVS
ncbi:uncharacterized protein LOC120344692 [Styela clava]